MFSLYYRQPRNRRRAADRRPGGRLRVERLEERCLLAASTQQVVAGCGQLSLSFEANVGQTDAQVRFLSHGSGYGLFLTANEAVLSLQKPSPAPGTNIPSSPADVLHMQLVGANPTPQAFGRDQQPGTSNYLIGNDPAQWHTNVANYGGVEYQDVYAGVNLMYYGNQRQLEYDFVVAPGANAGAIRLAFTGSQGLELDGQGNLVLHTAGGDVVEQAPVVYQESGGSRQAVSGHYVLAAGSQVGFAVGSYDAGRPLVIDPILSYSTYLGGSGTEEGLGIAVDAAGNAYITGDTTSTNFPTANPLQPANRGGEDAFVAKLNPAGTALVYATYLGGSGDDEGKGIAVDAAGNAYVTGFTFSSNFPKANALQPANGGGGDAFVAKLNAAGTALVYSTYLGGSSSDVGFGIAVDAAGNAYVTGVTGSTNFPTVNPLQPANRGGGDAFVAKLNATGSALVYSTYLGGSDLENGFGIAVDAAGNAYVTGVTLSTNFPTTANPLQSANGGGPDAFVAKLNAAGTALVYATYFGGSNEDLGNGIAVDTAGNAYVTGLTLSTNFPTTANPLQPAFGGIFDAFVAKLNAAGSALAYSTYLGGSGGDEGFGIAVDAAGNAYVTGFTTSTNFPTVNALQPANGGGADAFVAKLNAAGTALVYSTYLGGNGIDEGKAIAVHAAGYAYVTGSTDSTNFPSANPLQPANGGGQDAFVAKLAVLSGFGRSLQATEGQPFTGVVGFFVDNRGPAVAANFTAVIDWGDGGSSTGTIVPSTGGLNVLGSHTYAEERPDTPYPVLVTISSLDGQSATAISSATVGEAELKGDARTVGFTEAAPFSRVVASFRDSDPRAFAGQYKALVDWGDGSPPSPGTIAANGDGFDVTGTHTYATHGTYPITVEIFDGGDVITVASSAVVDFTPLSGQPRGISVFGNKSFNGVVATFSDPDPRKNAARYQATISWPDDNTASVVTPTGSNPFTVSGIHTFGSFAGTLTVKVVVQDLDAPVRTVTIFSRVADPPAPVMYGVFVTQLYGQLLERAPDAGGLQYWAGLLAQGVPRTQIVAGFVTSGEYRSLQVRHLYVTLLHREADPLGLNDATVFLQAGGTMEQLQAVITGSAEYWQSRSGGSFAGFFDAVYYDALGRQVDPFGQGVFQRALASGVSRAEVAAAVFGSGEYQQNLVQGFYLRFLQRPADSFGLGSFTDALRGGVSDEAVLTAIAGSPEYFAGLELPAGI